MKNHSRLLIITISTLLFILILRDILIYEITAYDNWAYQFLVDGRRNEELTLIMKLITAFGSGLVLLSLVFLMFAFSKDKKISFLALINLGLEHLLNEVIKVIIRRPRPTYGLVEESNYSFPSGHSMAATAFYGLIIYLVYKYIDNKKLKIVLILCLSLLIGAICISRIYLGVHYFSDTLGGVLITIVYLIAFVAVADKIIDLHEGETNGKESNKKKKNKC